MKRYMDQIIEKLKCDECQGNAIMEILGLCKIQSIEFIKDIDVENRIIDISSKSVVYRVLLDNNFFPYMIKNMDENKTIFSTFQ